MTKDSGVYHIPLPSDATLKPGSSDIYVSHAATVAGFTAFYKGFMLNEHWTFEPKYSTMDPDQGVAKALGYTTLQTWCRQTSPITTVIIIVGSGDKTDRGQYAEINIQSNQLEESCP